MFYDNNSVLSYLVTSRARRHLLRELWANGRVGSVSMLARAARVSFAGAHRELEAMRAAGLAVRERSGKELVYHADKGTPYADLVVRLANLRDEGPPERPSDDLVRSQLAALGAPLGSPVSVPTPPPKAESVLGGALALSHRDATLARVLPLVLWQNRHKLDLVRVREEATRRDERETLGLFLELAGVLGDSPELVSAARPLLDRRRKRRRYFFEGVTGPRAQAAARRNSPPQARKWGYFLNMGLDSFASTFAKFTGER